MSEIIERINVMRQEWDYLIILDACRYDYFEKVWGRYFDKGRLKCVHTIGTATVEWRDKTFTDRYDDVVYVSSNPYINSIKSALGFLGSEHFYKVYDVWKNGWDERLGTVRPEKITKAAADAVKAHPRKKMIIHYLQPHAPYLNLNEESLGFPVPDFEEQKIISELDRKSEDSELKRKLLGKLLSVFKRNRILGDHPEWLLRGFLNMCPKSPMDAVRRKYGVKELRKAYSVNLELVLEQAVEVLKYLSGKIVVTSDHGELLGEGRCFTHTPGSNSRYLLEVPWLEIEKDRSEAEIDEKQPDEEAIGIDSGEGLDSDREDISRKLKDLGYY